MGEIRSHLGIILGPYGVHIGLIKALHGVILTFGFDGLWGSMGLYGGYMGPCGSIQVERCLVYCGPFEANNVANK